MYNIFDDQDHISTIAKVDSINIYGIDKIGQNIPVFTIAIPTFKRITTLSETLESALSQVMFDDYNVIVVDNNPEREDETEIFMRKYRHHPKVTYYKNIVNVGMAGNWNKCALLANSNKFILLHDDDIIFPTALYYLNKILLNINGPWSMIKPELARFFCKSDLKYDKPKCCCLTKHCEIDYFGADCTGAPTVALFNRYYFIRIGGANQSFYPSIDYALSYRLNQEAPTYSASVILGGYRIGINESLSFKTMDKYFDMKFYINRQIFQHFKLPQWLQKSILTKLSFQDIRWVRSYYQMPDYTYDFTQHNIYKDDSLWMKLFSFLYYRIFKTLVNKVNSYQVILDK